MLTGKIDKGEGLKGVIDISKKYTVTFKDGNTVLQQTTVIWGETVTYNGAVPPKGNDTFLGWVLRRPANSSVDTDVFSDAIHQQISNVRENTVCWAVYDNHAVIRDSWEVISQRSLAGTAQNYYNVGDMKRIHIQGSVGIISFDSDVYVYILEFDHNSELEGNGITFGCFGNLSRGKFEPSAFSCGVPNSEYVDGEKVATMNHWSKDFYTSFMGEQRYSIVPYNYGGWAGCDLRYDILGSTDVAPSGYGAIVTTSRQGYDATSTCATDPIPNTLMSCLPSDLRAVMKPITKYTDNVGNSSNVSANVTSTIDYLPLLSEYEVYGGSVPGYGGDMANDYERDKQAQYSFFASNPNWKICDLTSPVSVSSKFLLRSPCKDGSTIFCQANGNYGDGNQLVYHASNIVAVFLI